MNADDIDVRREFNKIDLSDYTTDLDFESGQVEINKTIQMLKDRLSQEFIDLEKAMNENPEISLNSNPNIKILEEQLLAMAEMKVIYLYKEFEIHLKKIVTGAYGIKSNGFHKMEMIKNFFDDKKIKLSEIEGFRQLEEIRKVNNTLKHQSTRTISDEIAKIEEFKDCSSLQHYEILNFYRRVKDYPLTFLHKLTEEIYRELYVFDDERLNDFATKIALRMNKERGQKFIQILKEKYC